MASVGEVFVSQTAPQAGVFRTLARLAAPVVGLNVLAVLSLAVDTAMVGRLPGAAVSLTGMGYATQLAFLLMVAMMGLMVGTVAFVARAHGAGDQAQVYRVVRQSVTMTVLLGCSVAILGNIFARPLLSLLGAKNEDLVAGLSYLRPSLAFAMVTYLNLLLAAVLRGVGNTRLAFLVAIGSNLLNVVFNYLFILGNAGFPALGLMGAAIGTGLSQLSAVVLIIVLLAQGIEPALHLRLTPERPDPALLRALVRVGAPAAADMLVLNAGMLSIVGMLGQLDPLAVAAHGLGLRVQALAFVPGMGISQSIGALVGQALGRKEPERAWATLRSGILLCMAVMSTMAAGILVGRAAIVQIFDVDPTSPLGMYAQQWMSLLGWSMPVVGIYVAIVGALQGAGATRTSLGINLASTLLLQVPLSYVLGFTAGWGTYGVWLGLPLAFVGKAALGGWFIQRGTWAQPGKMP